MPSLIPHLRTGKKAEEHKSDEKIHLELDSYPDDYAGKHSAFPFLTISENDPITNLLSAGIYSDAGFLIENVFLLIQKDEYRLRKDDLWPIINGDIEKCWQRAYKAQREISHPGITPIFFKNQINEEDRLAPFQPLFLCRHTQRFFHPICPECERPISLCRDDGLLVKKGLEPYSESLSRYLYCEHCSKTDKNASFFVKKLRNQDPSHLKDMNDLIGEYRRLAEERKSSELPCSRCEHVADCFGSEKRAKNRIVAFSFYPFYMMTVKAPSLNAQDFIALLSGASQEEVLENLKGRGEYGRGYCTQSCFIPKRRFIFENDPRLFYEILYLKLTFLEEFATILFKNMSTYRHPDLSLSLDGIWVRLQQENLMLPAFWNFKVQPIDIGGNAPELTFIPRLPPFFSLYGLAVIWFCCLLANKKQGVAKIRRKISEETKRLASGSDHSFEQFMKDESEKGLDLENIFWAPDEMKSSMLGHGSGKEDILGEAKRFWEQTMFLGWSLLKSCLSGDADWSLEDFFGSLESLKDDLRRVLFGTSFFIEQKRKLSLDKNQAISRILINIAEKWRGQIGVEEEKSKEQNQLTEISRYDSSDLELEEVDEDEVDTLILSVVNDDEPETIALSPEKELDDEFSEAEADREDEVGGPTEINDDEAPETVVLTRDKTNGYEEASDRPDDQGDQISDDQSPDSFTGQKNHRENDDSEEETVIFSKEKSEDVFNLEIEEEKPDAEGKEDVLNEEEKDDEDMMQTLLLSSDEIEKRRGREPDPISEEAHPLENSESDNVQEKEIDDEDEEDFLSETVFLSTGKFKNEDEGPDAFFEKTEKKKDEKQDKKGPDSSGGDDDDDLMDTVIIDPEDNKK